MMEAFASITPGSPEPPLTKYTVGVIGHSQTLSIDAARRDLNYEASVSLDRGIRLTADYFHSHSGELSSRTNNDQSAQGINQLEATEMRETVVAINA
jgi:hypothetical protein